MKFGRTLQTGADRIRKRLSLYSDYDHIIPPEIKDDEFYEVIRDLASRAEVKRILIKEDVMPDVPGFTPSVNGLRFTNSWPSEPDIVVQVPPLGNVPIGDASNGLCGGMVFTVSGPISSSTYITSR